LKKIEGYYKFGLDNEKKVFDYLLNNLKDTIKTYDFFVAWDKILCNISKIEILLNIMNTLIGKQNIKEELKKLIKLYPEIVTVIPILIACRETRIKVANIGGDIEYSFKKTKEITNEEINKIVFFTEQCGLLKIISDKNIKNLVDYCLGVEVGLDTNARKNRSGTVMERLTEVYIKDICNRNGFIYLSQVTVAKIKSEFNVNVPTDKSDRHFDFAINTKEKLFLIEVNYYSGGGSKLKSVAGEFRSLNEFFNGKKEICFIWITDGLGWNTAKQPLLETFNAIDYVFNIKMIENSFLEEIIIKGL